MDERRHCKPSVARLVAMALAAAATLGCVRGAPIPPGEGVSLSLSVFPAQAGTASAAPPGGYYRRGTAVTLAATAAQGYRFARWRGDLTDASAVPTVVMEQDRAVEAVFTPEGALNVSGTLGSGFAAQGRRAQPRELASLATHIGAFTVVTGSFPPDAGVPVADAPILDEGSFSIDLQAGEDYILLLIDASAADRHASIAGYVAVVGGAQTVVLLPTAYVVQDLDLGLLERVADEAVPSGTVAEGGQAFALSAGQLDELAGVDDVFKTISNWYRNRDFATGIYYCPALNLFLRADAHAARNTFSPPQGYTLEGYALDIQSNDDANLAIAALLNGSMVLELVHPTPTTDHSGVVRDASTPFSTSGAWVEWARTEPSGSRPTAGSAAMTAKATGT